MQCGCKSESACTGALDLQTSTGLAALGVPGFRMFSAVPGMHGLSNRTLLPSILNMILYPVS